MHRQVAPKYATRIQATHTLFMSRKGQKQNWWQAASLQILMPDKGSRNKFPLYSINLHGTVYPIQGRGAINWAWTELTRRDLHSAHFCRWYQHQLLSFIQWNQICATTLTDVLQPCCFLLETMTKFWGPSTRGMSVPFNKNNTILQSKTQKSDRYIMFRALMKIVLQFKWTNKILINNDNFWLVKLVSRHTKPLRTINKHPFN